MSDNPPAFPRTGEGVGNPKYDEPGMRLRDWFAGQALNGFLADSSQRRIREACEVVEQFKDMGPLERAAVVNKELAAGSYALADAMLAERKGK